jgi:hypothetical protein
VNRIKRILKSNLKRNIGVASMTLLAAAYTIPARGLEHAVDSGGAPAGGCLVRQLVRVGPVKHRQRPCRLVDSGSSAQIQR